MPVLEEIRTFLENDNLKALIVRLDSPGGAVGASQEIYWELMKLKEKRPVIISMGNVAASGGLYIAVAGTEVLALPGSITGSMGVLMPLTNISRLVDKLHIDPMPIRSGEFKDAGNPMTPPDKEARAYLQEMVNKTFEQFRADVAEARSLSEEAVKYLSDARVVSGKEALELGLIDRLGSFQDAVDRAKELGGVEGDAELAYLSRQPKGLLERVLEMSITRAWNVLSAKLTTPYLIGPGHLQWGEN